MDNRWQSCPPLMQDRRIFTNYYDNDVFNQTIRFLNKIGDNHQYREFLQKNGSEIMTRERNYYQRKNTCDVHGRCV